MKILNHRLSTLILGITAVASVAAAADYDIITEQPEGTVTYYDRKAYGWYIYAGGNNVQYGEIVGPTKIVEAEDGAVYIQDPLTANKTGTYIRARREGNTITAQLPQVLCEIEDNEGSRPLYIGLLDPLYEEQGVTYLPVEADDVVTWTVHDDGTITMDHEAVAIDETGRFVDGIVPTRILGTYYYGIDQLTGEEGAIWNAVGDWYQRYTPVEMGEIVTLPEGLETEDWSMKSKDKTRMVRLAFDGDDVYIADITPYASGALVGHLEDNKLIIPTGQYLGFNEQHNANAWFLSATAVYIFSFGKYYLEHFDRTDALVFDYDPVARTLKTAKNECFLINASLDEINHFEYIIDPELKYLTPVGMNAAPMTPVVLNPGSDEGFDGLLYSVDIPAENVNGVALNTNNMYYNIYLNGELWTFYTDTYYYFDEDYTDLPYNYTDRYDLMLQGTVHNLYFHEEGIERIGIVSCFRGTDGKIYRSELVETEVSSLMRPEADAEVIGESWTDLSGRTVENPTAGFYIHETRYADGRTSRRKVYKK